ncbi:hypothetical protein [Microbacterium sp. EF45047]|uniref:hypothetical protein n=1 Tax=Microbacterium sp. EF45047 TaxID=2809708 RepID=UPI00234937FC|nr:hypothetical protein [Microbacterium sp. EF45047]WCM55954.1 hypothetical protein JRG78_01545 [Microbacterium sp. EF45047]
MQHEWTFAVVDGYATGEVDFARRLAESDQSVRDEVDEKIMSPLVNGTDGAVLVIQGHADRIDSGESHAVALEQESDISKARANSAFDEILAMIRRDWLDPGPASWEELPHIAVVVSPHGASMRVDESGTEAGRLRNRRVYLAVCRFIP